MAEQTVLLVEDNPMNMELASDLLEVNGFRVLRATTGAAGMDVAKRAKPDVILMDVDLPDIDGLEATRTLKRDSGTRGIPVVALTAYAMKGDEAKCRSAGCVGYLTKPIDTRKFAKQVTAFMTDTGERDR
jgi:two-component system, cell cycle response regulator DivK